MENFWVSIDNSGIIIIVVSITNFKERATKMFLTTIVYYGKIARVTV